MHPDTKFFLTILGSFILLFAVLIYLDCKWKSETYNRLTGAHTTTWDAFTIELKIQDKPKP